MARSARSAAVEPANFSAVACAKRGRCGDEDRWQAGQGALKMRVQTRYGYATALGSWCDHGGCVPWPTA
eukprot:scaffold25640_cov146-Isochrysis_galbana.AAC.2